MALRARLLLVDDDELNRDLLGRRLLRSGYEVEAAANGREALEVLSTRPYDLVLLDHMMPGIGGLDVLRQIRGRYPSPELPVIMTTAAPTSEGIVSALRLGANDYLLKPLDFPAVLERIELALQAALAAREMRRTNELYQLALRASEEGLWDWDLVGGRVYYSARWKAMLGLPEQDTVADPEVWFERIHPDDLPRVQAEVDACRQGRAANLECQYRIRHQDGLYRWVENRGTASRDATGNTVRMAGYQSDITTEKTVDLPTSSFNREWLDEELRALASEGRRTALLLLELEGFDQVEESLSHQGAQRLLAAVATRLRDALGGAGRGTNAALARFGDHQFAVVLRDTTSPAAAQQFATSLQACLGQPFHVDGETIFVSAGIGIATSYDDTQGEELLHDAVAALRHARGQGRGSSELFRATMRQHDIDEAHLENDLRRALDKGEFEVHYQPKVNLQTGAIEGFEALARWRRPGQGLVPPVAFIPAAEQTGLIVPLGRLVLERACQDAAEVRRTYPHMTVSVNVSGRQFSEADLVERVRDTLVASQLDPCALRLEITETVLLGDPEKAFGMLARLRAMGVAIKLDDFGAGYSSLNYLQRFPFDMLKIDRSFVTHLTTRRESEQIVRAIIGLASSLHMTVCAEGIENRAQLERLVEMGCQYGQGYWFSPPVELARLKELLAGWTAVPAGVEPATTCPAEE